MYIMYSHKLLLYIFIYIMYKYFGTLNDLNFMKTVDC